jgi:ABC-type transporter Mla MlaB component
VVELAADLCADGFLECRISDRGTWKEPDPAVADRGHGLMVAGQVVDHLVLSHPPQAADGGSGGRGTVVTLRHRLRRPTILASDASAHAAGRARDPPFAVDVGADGAARHAGVCGPVDITTADRLARQLLSASRGGTLPLTVDLSSVSHLASAGVRALYQVTERFAAHRQGLTLVAAAGTRASIVLDLARLPHVSAGAGGEASRDHR